jgi:DtxR family Mn-dependent transcriptional regulator
MTRIETPEYHPAFEEYCETIFELREDDLSVIQARVAERLQVSRPAVSEMVKRMESQGLVTVEKGSIKLTGDGLDLAEST